MLPYCTSTILWSIKPENARLNVALLIPTIALYSSCVTCICPVTAVSRSRARANLVRGGSEITSAKA